MPGRRKPADHGQRTCQFFRDSYGAQTLCQKVERFIPQAKRRVDLFGVADYVVVTGDEIFFVQVCARSGFAAHWKKLVEERAEEVSRIMNAGGEVAVLTWVKRPAEGNRRLVWTPDIRFVGWEDLETAEGEA